MQANTNLPAIALLNDIEALITEIDDNPQLSPWVVRLILKSIKDKGRKMMAQSNPGPVAVSGPAYLEALPSASSVSKLRAKVARSL